MSGSSRWTRVCCQATSRTSVGVAQVPLGVAGPLSIIGEHAQGDFYVPLATTEGTLVASYNRGMRLLNECGGVKTTVVDDHMQRAPVFIFDDALAAREFGRWVVEHEEDIRAVAEATTRSGKLSSIGQYAGWPTAVSARQLHDGRRRRTEHDLQGDARRLRVD